ncbi:uncharacterized protein LOC120397321 [Mauremys reevesii]|uniref:uncharacterized protein LOC120397321 n=1 Tax=Mauremys reevesii TaxID=260615 RepID=UPI00193EFE32|nr:uncharacterized protein LOC120397321 [Mauremys reevesii]
MPQADINHSLDVPPSETEILQARVLLNPLIDHLEQGLLPKTQCGFRKERGTVDMIFAVRQLQEKCQEQNCELYTIFVDLTKAFDTVSREGLWRIMSKFGCPDRFILMVRQFHDGMMARVLDDGEASEAFPVTNGVKQDLPLNIRKPSKSPHQKTQRTRQTSTIGNQNECRDSVSSDSDNESEDELHYVMLPDTAHGTEALNPKAETFHPQVRNEDVVDCVNLKAADHTDVTLMPAVERPK